MAIDTTLRSAHPASASAAAGARRGAPAPAASDAASQRGASSAAPLPIARVPAAGKRAGSGWDSRVQDEVARAQQALDYLDRVAGQLETLKGQLAARLSGARGDEQQLQARVRELAASLDARPKGAGGGVDSRLDFDGKPATQRFRIRGLDMDALQAAGPQTLAFSIGAAGGPQLSVALEPGLSRQEIAQRFDRALAPLKVRAQLDERGQLLFSTAEANWPAVKDSIAISGRGKVATDEEAPAVNPHNWEGGNPDALRQSLREVVQALARVRRSQEAASAALSAATARVGHAKAAPQAADAAGMAQHFASSAANPNYDSLLELTAALVGVSRERVLALLGLPQG
jgi:hypothetical protein